MAPANTRRRLSPAPLALALALAVGASPAAAVPGPPKHKAKQRPAASDLWATVDVCNAKDKPNTIGIRGSMPGDGHPEETMYMRFRVQYLDAATLRWVYIAQKADSGFIPVGSAKFKARQAGRDFQLVPHPGLAPYTLRGVVVFQWRRAKKLVRANHRVTTDGHHSAAGADPRGFSAATCKL